MQSEMVQAFQDNRHFSAHDPRASNHERSIIVSAAKVQINRTYVGVAMSIAVPMRAYRGVLLSLHQFDNGVSVHRVTLLHVDAELCVILEEGTNAPLVEAACRNWCALLAQPQLVERSPGKYIALDNRANAAGAPTQRRPQLANTRRGRFARRRKQGDTKRLGTSFAGADETTAR